MSKQTLEVIAFSILLALVIVGTLYLNARCRADKAEPDQPITLDPYITTYSSDFVDIDTSISYSTSLAFMGESSEEVFSISWEGGIVDVQFAQPENMTEAAKAFFLFLKTYINENYTITPRKNKEDVSNAAQPDVDLLTDTDQDFLPILAAGAGSQ